MTDKDDKKTELEDEDKLEVEVEDEEGEEKKAEPKKAEPKKAESDDDDEVSQYSERVQKRIKKLTWEQNEARRERERAEQIRDQAVEFARAQHNELVKLRRTLADGETSLVNTGKSGVEARLASARAALKAANESGDSAAIAAAQEELATVVSLKNQWDNYQPQYQVDQNDPRMKPLPPQPRRPQAPRPTPEAEEWVARNTWFNKDTALTGYAYGLHEKLIKEGVQPDSPEYYEKLDAGMKPVLSSQQSSRDEPAPQPSRSATVVASSSRTEGTPRKVRLTASQAALVRKLGITPEEYAKEMMKASK